MVLVFFLLTLILLTACHLAGSDKPKPQTTVKFLPVTDETLPACEGEDLTVPGASSGEEGKVGHLPPGVKYDPDQPDKYLYFDEWHG